MGQYFKRVSISQCNTEKVRVFFDANVIIDARHDDLMTKEHIHNLLKDLRCLASITLYEIAFNKGHGSKADEEWALDNFIMVPARNLPRKDVGAFYERAGRNFENFLKSWAYQIRGLAHLGDCLLVCWALAHSRGDKFALATRNSRDFEGIPVPLVSDFLVSMPKRPNNPARRE